MSEANDRFTPCCNYGFKTGDKGPIYWNPFNGAVCCHNCGAAFYEMKPQPAPPQTNLEQAAYAVVEWFDYTRPDLKGPRIAALKAALPPIDWRDAITVVPVEASK